jgi:hypothetical protein
MFCPVCKTEYREGFKACSDCRVELVDGIPEYGSPNAFEVLWSGESAVFQDRLLEELEQEKIGAVGIPRAVLFRNTGGALGIRREPRFGFAVCVQSPDLRAARRILEQLLEQDPEEALPAAESAPFSAFETVVASELPPDWNPTAACLEVWSGEEEGQLTFLEDSLHGVGVPTRRTAEAGDIFRLMIRPEDEARGKEVVRQILEKSAPSKPLPGKNKYIWLDEPVKSYWPILILGVAYVILVFIGVSSPDVESHLASLLSVLAGIATFAANVGTFWMFYQSVRYEIRPLRFIIISFIPFAFVWYYFERYSKRTGVRRLPVAMRVRLSPPPSA